MNGFCAYGICSASRVKKKIKVKFRQEDFHIAQGSALVHIKGLTADNMGKTYSKEEVIIAQNAAGSGSNTANLEQLHTHMSYNNLLMTIFLTIILLVIFIVSGKALYNAYKKCHQNWTRAEISRDAMKRINV